MIIVMSQDSDEHDRARLLKLVKNIGCSAIIGHNKIIVTGDEHHKPDRKEFELLRGVENIIPIMTPYKLASREVHPENTLIPIGDSVVFGGDDVIVIAGPGMVEGEAQLFECACAVKAAGAKILHGGVFRPHNSPYTFQGMEEKCLKLLAKARDLTGLPVATEVVDLESVDLVADYADIIQIGPHNSQNFTLLKKVGRLNRPVLLNRGMAMTIQELLMSAEYILSEGNQHVILCERGIRTFETATRNILDLSAIPVLRKMTHLPVIVDPSHGTGNYLYVAPLAFAAVAAGADGLLIDVHPDPQHTSSAGLQSLKPSRFASMMSQLGNIANAASRRL